MAILEKNVHLDCSVKDFFAIFLADASKISLASCHEKTGSFDVNDTKWGRIEGGHNNNTMQRKIRYKNAVYVPSKFQHYFLFPLLRLAFFLKKEAYYFSLLSLKINK